MAAWAEAKKRAARRKEEMERLLKRPILRKTGFVVVMVVYEKMGRGLYRVGAAEKWETTFIKFQGMASYIFVPSCLTSFHRRKQVS